MGLEIRRCEPKRATRSKNKARERRVELAGKPGSDAPWSPHNLPVSVEKLHEVTSIHFFHSLAVADGII